MLYFLLCAEQMWCHLSNTYCFIPQVARLVEMGFSRIDALEALRASNNDINMATNFLLQHWGKELSEEQTGVKEDRRRRQEKKQPKKRKGQKMLQRIKNTEWWWRRNLHSIVTAPRSSVRLTWPDLSSIAGWLMKKCEAQSERHLRHSYLTAVVVWSRRQRSRQTS